MNEWQLYRAKCEECVFYDSARSLCGRNPERREKGVCQTFTLTVNAETERYCAAKLYAKSIGMNYDASGVILAGKPRAVRKLIAFKMKKKGAK